MTTPKQTKCRQRARVADIYTLGYWDGAECNFCKKRFSPTTGNSSKKVHFEKQHFKAQGEKLLCVLCFKAGTQTAFALKTRFEPLYAHYNTHFVTANTPVIRPINFMSACANIHDSGFAQPQTIAISNAPSPPLPWLYVGLTDTPETDVPMNDVDDTCPLNGSPSPNSSMLFGQPEANGVYTPLPQRASVGASVRAAGLVPLPPTHQRMCTDNLIVLSGNSSMALDITNSNADPSGVKVESPRATPMLYYVHAVIELDGLKYHSFAVEYSGKLRAISRGIIPWRLDESLLKHLVKFKSGHVTKKEFHALCLGWNRNLLKLNLDLAATEYNISARNTKLKIRLQDNALSELIEIGGSQLNFHVERFMNMQLS